MIKEGSLVQLHFSRNDIYSFQTGPTIKATLIRLADRTDRPWVSCRTPGNQDFTVNPFAGDFVGMEECK